jgi:predicted CXXCH cytochrome family protein
MLTLLAFIAGIAGCTRKPAEPIAAPASIPTPARFVGSNACAECHAEAVRAWSASQHAVAMQVPGERSVLGDFNDAHYENQGEQSSFSRRGDAYVIRTEGPDGKPADFDVRYTFGVAPLQQYLVEGARGRLQAFSIAWDARPREQGGQRWFRQYPHQRIDHADELPWTHRALTWNFMCADCHSTGVSKGYDLSNDAYVTRFAEVGVGCEACHGPGSAHVEWARGKGTAPGMGLTVHLDERKDASWQRDARTGQPVRVRPRPTAREIEACAQCHARRAQIAEGYVAGRAFLDHYLPSLLTSPLYYADGQQRDEVFVWGSFLQSRMNAAGVTCSDCHDPHTSKLRAPGNAVCARCHDATKYDATAHHHHRRGSAGAACADCHMPRTTYMVVDSRRDHSLRVPRPDQSVSLGVPNACNDCHRDRDARWAARTVHHWYGHDASGFQTFAEAFAGAERGNRAALDALSHVATDEVQPEIVRASALVRLAASGRYTRDFALAAARDPDPLVRFASVQLADRRPPEARVDVLAPLLADPLRAVRIEAARSLAGAQDRLSPAQQKDWKRAADDYLATLDYASDQPESHVALGVFRAALGEHEAAAKAFDAALRLDPSFEPAYVNAADVLRAQGRDGAAEAMLLRGLGQAPKSASLHHALGLTQVRLGQLGLALGSLRRAVELDESNARYAYVYAVALHSSGAGADAIERLQDAAKRWPNDRDVLMALTSFELDAGRRADAANTARRLLDAYPGDPEVGVLAARAGVTSPPR